ncbi:MAG: hypothetical protein V9E99_13800 [Microthrixaceae bacterium]|jgi:hypothetical protein|nr:hypothetical protein [Actinomycetota bacterium]
MSARRPSVAEERAAQQAAALANRDRRRAALDAHFVDGVPGAATIRANQAVTAVSLALWGAAALSDAAAVGGMVFVWNLAVFAVALVWTGAALVAGAQRSREADMTMAGWWFLAGSAPRSVWWSLVGLTVVQSVAAIAAASLTRNLSGAFSVLVPLFGVGASGWWGARHGWFPERRD